MKNNSKGFGAVEALVMIVLVGLLGTVGWLVLDRQKAAQNGNETTTQTQTVEQKTENVEKPKLSSKISFENEASFDPTEKQKILSQLAEPLLFYHEEILKIELKEVVIKKSTNMANSSDARYALSYPYRNDPASSNLGFIFGYNNKLEYWQPLLCGQGGCKEYPVAFKNKFPENYNAYVACKAADDAGDKEKAIALGCSTF